MVAHSFLALFILGSLVAQTIVVTLFDYALEAARNNEGAVRGPATACVKTLHQIGWSDHGLSVWKIEVVNVSIWRPFVMPKAPYRWLCLFSGRVRIFIGRHTKQLPGS